VVLTHGNTVRDSLQLVPATIDPGVEDLPAHFGLVSLHRIELLQDPRFKETLHVLRDHAQTVPLVMVFDPVTDEQINKQGLNSIFDGARFRRIPKLPYFRFVSLLKRSRFVVTDSGGLQEECAVLGKPCLVHRQKTERHDGLGSNALLSGMDPSELARFLESPPPTVSPQRDPAGSPSDVIVADLVARGMA
jgi:UDP-N-acetylglucosamine 2-epimerase (non-hydrolysing)